jgi:hypothetical protein
MASPARWIRPTPPTTSADATGSGATVTAERRRAGRCPTGGRVLRRCRCPPLCYRWRQARQESRSAVRTPRRPVPQDGKKARCVSGKTRRSRHPLAVLSVVCGHSREHSGARAGCGRSAPCSAEARSTRTPTLASTRPTSRHRCASAPRPMSGPPTPTVFSGPRAGGRPERCVPVRANDDPRWP